MHIKQNLTFLIYLSIRYVKEWNLLIGYFMNTVPYVNQLNKIDSLSNIIKGGVIKCFKYN